MTNKISVTKLEADVIENGFGKSNFNTEGNQVWANSLIEGCKICTLKQLPGVVSSLIKKGLALSEGEGSEKTVCLTDNGKKILNRFRNTEEVLESAPPKESPVVAEEPAVDKTPEELIIPAEQIFVDLIIACNTKESALNLIGEIRKSKPSKPSKVKADKVAKPKKVTNTEAVLRVLTETGKTTVDEVAKRLMEIHGTKNLSQAIHLIETVHNHGVPTNKTKENGVKFIELVS
jgi:predicted transcriptional regulator/ATP-dependent Clp protease adapter protein ClpS